nr:hypothetical protein [Tanacetum cinerariifolium]
MANTQTPFHPDHSSFIQHPQSNNFVPQPSFNTNYMQHPMQNPKDISNPTIALDMALKLMAKAFQLNNTTPTNNNQRSSLNPCYSQFAQSSMNIDQYRHMLMVDDNVGNQFRQNAVQYVGHHANRNVLAARAEGNSNGINENPISKIQLTYEEFDFMAAAGACEKTERDNANCTLENNLQQASTSTTQSDKALVYDPDRSVEVSSMEQGGGTVEQQSANVEETHAYHESLFHNLAAEVEKVNSVPQDHDVSSARPCFFIHVIYAISCLYIRSLSVMLSRISFHVLIRQEAATFVRDFKSLAKEADEYLANHKALELKIERLLRVIVNQDIMSIGQTQLGDLKGNSKDTPCVSNTLDPLPQKLENENAKLEFQVRNYEKENAHLKTAYKNLFDSISVTRAQTKTIIDSLKYKLHDTIYENFKLRAQLFDKVFEQKGTTHGTNANTKFVKQSILGKPPSSSRPKLYAVNPIPKSADFLKVGIFRMNPFKAFRIDNFVPNKHVKASVKTKPINVSQLHVITKNDANSKTNGFSHKDIKSTTRTRRPQHMNNPESDKVPFKSKSSCLSNKLEKIEENHRSLQSSNYPDNTSSECNNIKLVIRNKKSKGMNSRALNKNANA